MRLLYLALVLVFCFVLANTKEESLNCPNSCSSHGQCVQNACVCSPGWGGWDCSVVVHPLIPAQPANDKRIAPREWHYYSTNVSEGKSITWVVQSANGDVDLFVRNGSLPTRAQWLARDVSLLSYFNLTVLHAMGSPFYAGVYCFSGNPQYSISVKLSTYVSCLHGTLNDSICHCEPNWAGPTCAIAYNDLSLNSIRHDKAQAGSWSIYRVATGKALDVTTYVNISRGSCDLDIYAKFKDLVNATNWDVAEIDHISSRPLELHSSNPGFWFFGIFNKGRSVCNYFINAVADNCYSDSTKAGVCSLHGTCNRGVCVCNNTQGWRFNGSNCENMVDALQIGQVVHGMVMNGDANWYHFQINSISQILVSLSTLGPCVLVAKEGSRPSLADYDAVNTTLTSKFSQITLLLYNSPATNWFLGVFSDTLSITSISVSLASCHCVHGICTPTGGCNCTDGYIGDNCDRVAKQLSSNVNATGSLQKDMWDYYRFKHTQNYLSIHVKEENGSGGNIWLFVSFVMPTLSEFLYADRESNTKHHHVTIDSSNTGWYYIGVTTSPLLLEPTQKIAYAIEVWEAPF